jgi:hypothetical protein
LKYKKSDGTREAAKQQVIKHFFYGNRNANHHLGTGFSIQTGIRSALKRVKFVGDRMSYTILRGCMCDIFALNVHAPTEDKNDGTRDNFYEEPEHIFNQFLQVPYEIFVWKFQYDQELEMRVYMKLIMKTGLQKQTLPHQKNMSTVQCPHHITTFINMRGLLIGRCTFKFIMP